MGYPPPISYSSPGDAGVDASLDFPPSPEASPCGFALGLPRFKVGVRLPGFSFPPTFRVFLAFKLVCKLPNPIDVTAGVDTPFGGGRVSNADPDPDLNEDSP